MRESYQIRLHVIEARALKGSSASNGHTANPVAKVRLQAGEGPSAVDEEKYTRRESSSNTAFWNEVIIFQASLSRDTFNAGRIEVSVEDAGFFTNTLIGSAHFDLLTVYGHADHEIYGQWVALTDAESGASAQGFLRLSITILREGDTPRIHGPRDLEAGQEPELGLVLNMPQIETEGYLLRVRVNTVELAPYGLEPPPRIQCRVRFGAAAIASKAAPKRAVLCDLSRSSACPSTCRPSPTASWSRCSTRRRRRAVAAAAPPPPPRWRRDRPLPLHPLAQGAPPHERARDGVDQPVGVRPRRGLLGALMHAADESGEATSYRGRLLAFAACEKPMHDQRLEAHRLPVPYSPADLESLRPREEPFTLRVDLYEGCDVPSGPFDSAYVVATLGPSERRSASCPVNEGVVRFESDTVGQEGYYQHLDDVRIVMPSDPSQHYDIFVHLYVGRVKTGASATSATGRPN